MSKKQTNNIIRFRKSEIILFHFTIYKFHPKKFVYLQA